MSTRKEQRREEIREVATIVTTPSQVHQEQRRSFNITLDQIKDNIRRATDQASGEIPRFTQAVNGYQEQTIQAGREIAENYVEAQKEIIDSFQSAWLPKIETMNKVFTTSWVSPRHLADPYATIVSTLTDNTIAAIRLVNNTRFANLEAFKTSVQNARDNAKELTRIGVNSVRTLGQTLA